MTDDLITDGHFDLDMLLQREDETLTHAACRVILNVTDAREFQTLTDDLKAHWEPAPAAQLLKLLYAMIDAINAAYADEQTPEEN